MGRRVLYIVEGIVLIIGASYLWAEFQAGDALTWGAVDLLLLTAGLFMVGAWLTAHDTPEEAAELSFQAAEYTSAPASPTPYLQGAPVGDLGWLSEDDLAHALITQRRRPSLVPLLTEPRPAPAETRPFLLADPTLPHDATDLGL